MIHTIGYGTVNGTMTVRAVARAAERDAVNDLIDQIAGTMLTHLSCMSAGARATCRSGAVSTRW